MNGTNNNLLQADDAKTRLVGHNRLELLLFRLSGKQRYGINVFKVREVINCPVITKLPHAHPAVKGIISLRGNTFTVIDLQAAMGMPALLEQDNCSVIVTEYNRKIQGFLVPHIEHIVNKHWEDIHVPPRVAGNEHFLTGITQQDDEILEILDVEKVLYEIVGKNLESNEPGVNSDTELAEVAKRCHILIVDDSSVARSQIKRTLDGLGVAYTFCNEGRAALNQLLTWTKNDAEEFKRLALVIADVEMPEMDGYTLTAEIRNNEKLKDLNILLHTSLSGVLDSSLLDTVQADEFLAKFDSGELLAIVTKLIEKFSTTLEKRGL